MVSYSAWGSGVLLRQETFRQEISRLRFAALEMTGRRKTIVYHSGRKLVEKVSYPAWDDDKSSWQETVCEWFPIRRGTKVIHSDRKLFAYSFLSGMGRLRIIATGNYSRMVSYSTWEMGIHSDRKLFANGFPFDMR